MTIQFGKDIGEIVDEGIPRLKKNEIKNVVLNDINVEKYFGPKKPPMPHSDVVQEIHSPEVDRMGSSAAKIATEKDTEFFEDITCKPSTPKYSGYNTK